MSQNRIQVAIDRAKLEIANANANDNLDNSKAEKLNRALDISFEDYVKFQELKSLAVTSNTLSLEEAQQVYGYLGSTPDTFNAQPLEVKVVLTHLLMELIKKRLFARAGIIKTIVANS